MTRTIRMLVLAFAVLAAASSARALEAGAAKTEITPPLGTPLAGYGDRMGRDSVRIHDPVWARCLYLNDGETDLFLVTTDLCAIAPELRDRVLELAPREVPPERIILTATHTHSAQGGMIRGLIYRAVTGRYVPELLETTAVRIADTMRRAYDARRRAAIGYGTFEQDDLTRNRRDKDGPIDKQVGVIRVEDADGRPIAILANMAAHPTSVGGDDKYSVSADYPGYFYDQLEKAAEGDCVALFMNGAQGNQTIGDLGTKGGWERTEAIGRALADRTMAVAKEVQCGEARLHVGYATPEFPKTIAPSLVPQNAVLYTLEINDLLLTFIPGEPCVEIGLALREQALARGYNAQFTVGVSNAYSLYFVPFEYYAKPCYETGMNFYGPGVSDWYAREFTQLMTRGDPVPASGTPLAPETEDLGNGVTLVRLSGTPREIGFQRGAYAAALAAEDFQKHIVAACDSGALIPNEGLWSVAPPFINLTTLALPRLAIGTRPMLAGLSEGAWREIQGCAEGANMSFDAMWLLQCVPILTGRITVADFYESPFCTMFAVVGDKAGADGVLVGRNFDWPEPMTPVLFQVTPNEGNRYLQVDIPWRLGVFTGINEHGLTVSVERIKPLGEPSIEGAPLELLLRDILVECASVEEAMPRLAAAPHLRGYHLLIVDRNEKAGQVLEMGPRHNLRAPDADMLLGVRPEGGRCDEAAASRYTRLNELLTEERIVSVSEIQETLADSAAGKAGQLSICNEHTRYSAVFEPRQARLHIAVPRPEGGLGEFVTVELGRSGS